jgi:hypothetical protein
MTRPSSWLLPLNSFPVDTMTVSQCGYGNVARVVYLNPRIRKWRNQFGSILIGLSVIFGDFRFHPKGGKCKSREIPCLLTEIAFSLPYPRIRVVYSRLFPDWTPDQIKPQTGRVNNSPHILPAFSNRSIAMRDEKGDQALIAPIKIDACA